MPFYIDFFFHLFKVVSSLPNTSAFLGFFPHFADFKNFNIFLFTYQKKKELFTLFRTFTMSDINLAGFSCV